MTRLHGSFFLCVLSLIATALGCSDDHGGEGSTKLSALSESQATALCEEFQRHAVLLMEQQCSWEGVQLQDEATSCEQARDACIEEAQEACKAETLMAEYAECNATIDDLRQCNRGQVKEFEEAFAGLSCKSSEESFDAALASVQAAEGCLLLFAKCPSLFADEDSEAFAPRALRRWVPQTSR